MTCQTPYIRILQTAFCLLSLLAIGCRPDPSSSSPREFLRTAWETYKQTYVDPAGYVLDRTRNEGEVTSEGQSYALLRALWIGDKLAFETIFHWTEENLKRPDGLYAWRWSPAGSAKVLDWNTATDGDQDIAFALILASHHFANPDYLRRAADLLRSIRTHTGIRVGDKWFPSAGNWAVNERIVNLSYFAPYAHPYFDRADPEGRWMAALEAGYDLLAGVRSLPEVSLIPDFMSVSPSGAAVLLPPDNPFGGDFSFDAMRIFWRVTLDCRLHHRMRACSDPAGASAIVRLLSLEGKIVTRYRLDGTPVSDQESLSFYGSLLPSLQDHWPATAEAVLRERLSAVALTPILHRSDRYYDLNWIWFGLAAADGLISERTPGTEIIFP